MDLKCDDEMIRRKEWCAFSSFKVGDMIVHISNYQVQSVTFNMCWSSYELCKIQVEDEITKRNGQRGSSSKCMPINIWYIEISKHNQMLMLL